MAACGKCDGESPQIALIKPVTYPKLTFLQRLLPLQNYFCLKVALDAQLMNLSV